MEIVLAAPKRKFAKAVNNSSVLMWFVEAALQPIIVDGVCLPKSYGVGGKRLEGMVEFLCFSGRLFSGRALFFEGFEKSLREMVGYLN